MALRWNPLYIPKAGSEVSNRFDEFSRFARHQMIEAGTFTQKLKDFAIDEIPLTVPQFSPDASYTQFAAPDSPDRPTFSGLTFSPLPDAPATDIAPFVSPAKPDPFDVATPVVNEIPTPTLRDVQPPGAAPTIEDVDLPETPDFPLPPVPTLDELDIPDAPELHLDDLIPARPEFDYPDVYENDYIRNTGEARAAIFDTVDSEFHQALEDYNMRNPDGGLTASRLGEMLQGGTGLPAVVENALFERAFAREDKSAQQAIRQATGQWAARGFTMPGATLLAQVEEAERQNREARSTLNREITIQMHQQEIENLRFAVQQGIAMEGQMFDQFMRMHDAGRQIADQAFAVTQAIFDASLQIVRTKIEVYQADLQAQREKIQTELAKLEVFRSQLEGERIRGEINQQKIAIYQARLDAVRTGADIFRTEVEAANSKIRAQMSKVEIFNSQIQAYRAELDASKVPFEVFAIQNQAEQSKVDLFEAQVRAYGERVRAYGTEVQAEAAKVDASATQVTAATSAYEARTRAWSSEVGAQTDRISSEARRYEAEIRGYSAELSAEEARVNGEARNFQLEIEKERARVSSLLKVADQRIEQLKHATNLGMEATKTGATVYSQLTGSALSAINVSARISQSLNSQTSWSSNYNENASL